MERRGDCGTQGAIGMAKRAVVDKTDVKTERRDRLAAALRANLRRRKTQARDRSEQPEPPTETDDDGAGG